MPATNDRGDEGRRPSGFASSTAAATLSARAAGARSPATAVSPASAWIAAVAAPPDSTVDVAALTLNCPAGGAAPPLTGAAAYRVGTAAF
ncbi:MAG TPA: hypothetical protein VNO55_02335 [Polyangia bacterium]|nr:hypothetical protein [Polyangia bacterium]